jgi:hypothetical protein
VLSILDSSYHRSEPKAAEAAGGGRYNGLIPTTWKAPATSIYGQIVEGLNCQFQISQALEDFGGDFGLRTALNCLRAIESSLAT